MSITANHSFLSGWSTHTKRRSTTPRCVIPFRTCCANDERTGNQVQLKCRRKNAPETIVQGITLQTTWTSNFPSIKAAQQRVMCVSITNQRLLADRERTKTLFSTISFNWMVLKSGANATHKHSTNSDTPDDNKPTCVFWTIFSKCVL